MSESSNPYQTTVPVVFVIDQIERRIGRWTSPDWELASFQLAPVRAVPTSVSVTTDEHENGSIRSFWQGFSLRLFKDACESYWANLMSGEPRVFIICESDDDEGPVLKPQLVTASQDEAMAHMETDSIILSVDMPFELVTNVERFVVENYVPEVKKKRKRVEGDALGSKNETKI